MVVSGQGEFVQNLARQRFLFDLLTHVPLHEVVGGVIFGLQAQVHHVVDALRHFGFVGQNAFENLFQSTVGCGTRVHSRHFGHRSTLVHKAHKLQHVLALLFRMFVQELGNAVKPLGLGPYSHGQVGVRTLAFKPDLLVQGFRNGVVHHDTKVLHSRRQSHANAPG